MKNINPKVLGKLITLIFTLLLFVYLFGIEMLLLFSPTVVGAIIIIGLIKLFDV